MNITMISIGTAMMALAILLAINIVSAESIQFNTHCNGDLLVKTANVTIGSTVYPIEIEKVCEEGCDSATGQCRPKQMEGWLWTIGIVLFIILIGWLLSRYI